MMSILRAIFSEPYFLIIGLVLVIALVNLITSRRLSNLRKKEMKRRIRKYLEKYK